MGSGRHGAARPPLGVLIQADRLDFALNILQIFIALVCVVAAWGNLIVFGVCFVSIVASITLVVRRVQRLSRDEVEGEELL